MQCSVHEGALRRFVIETTGEPLIVLDQEGKLACANRAARELLPECYACLLDPDGPYSEELSEFRESLWATGCARTELQNSLDCGAPRRLQLEGTTVDRHHFIRVRDVTGQRALEEELRQLRRVESAGLLTLSVMHDLGNLLTPILVLSERLADGDPDERFDSKSVARQIAVAADRAAGLAHQLLAFGRSAGPKALAVNTNDVLLGMRSLLDGMLPDDVRLALSLEERLNETLVDRGRLEHVVLNLVANARDAMPMGGHITLRTENVLLEPRHSGALGPAARGPFVALSVADTGTGIRQEHLNRVFDRFFTTKDERGGTGLGLAMARSFVTEAGGLIAVRSEEGRGTVVTLYLPHAGPVDPPSTARTRDRAGAAGGCETVLLVEKDDDLRACVRKVLEERGYAVVEPATVQEAMRLASDHMPHAALALLGIELTDGQAHALVERLRACDGRRPKVLLMSSHPLELLNADAFGGSGLRWLRKPFKLDELVKGVRDALDHADTD